MPIPLTALFAATLQQVRSADSDPAAMARVADLLARAAGAGPATWEVEPTRLIVNGVPVPNGAPGVTMVRAALTRHHISQLRIPGHTDAVRWSDLAATLESASGLYPTTEHFVHAVQAAVPGTEVVIDTAVRPDAAEETEPTRAAMQRAPVSPFAEPEPNLVSREADRAVLSVRLEPLIEAGMAAAQRWDWGGIATMLLELHDLEADANDAERWIIAQERHRVVTTDVLRGIVRELPTLGAGSPLSRGFATLGGDAVEAILEALAEDPGRPARHSYIAALLNVEHAEPELLEALAPSTPTAVLRDVIDVVGRRRIERAVPTLAAMRHHADERIRTAAMRALEDIGTAEAIAALR